MQQTNAQLPVSILKFKRWHCTFTSVIYAWNLGELGKQYGVDDVHEGVPRPDVFPDDFGLIRSTRNSDVPAHNQASSRSKLHPAEAGFNTCN